MVSLTVDEVASEFWQGNFIRNATRPEYRKEGSYIKALCHQGSHVSVA